MTDRQPHIVLLSPPKRRDEVFVEETYARLRSLGRVTIPDGSTEELAAQLPFLLPGADALLTGWGAPALTARDLAAASRLRIISHFAGSVKQMVPRETFDLGIVVCHAADVIAEAVSELAVMMMLTGLRRPYVADRILHAGGEWRDARYSWFGNQLSGQTVGLVGFGYVARRVRALLRPFAVRVLVYDPHLPPERANALEVESVTLDDLFSLSLVVSNHAPITPATRHLIQERHLALLREGAVFINTARSWTVDQDALLRQLRTSRFWAALDVFDTEPLPEDSPFRGLDNAMLTPHLAGQTRETYVKQGLVAVEELERFFAGQPLKYRINPAVYDLMA
jgi:phosphoglycerate dehydrogenase-like enzyme